MAAPQVVQIKDKEAFEELRNKMVTLQRQYNQVSQRAQFRKKDQRHLEVTLGELENCPAGTSMYLGIGKAFVMEEPASVKKQLSERHAAVSKEVGTVATTGEYLKKQLTEVEKAISDLIIRSNPGLEGAESSK